MQGRELRVRRPVGEVLSEQWEENGDREPVPGSPKS